MQNFTSIEKTGFLQGGGEMGELVRNYPWENTSLGKPNTWPLTLLNTVGLILHAASPQFLFWGEDLICFYNDAYRRSLGTEGKHPVVGKKGREAWAEIWDNIGPLVDNVMRTGQSSYFENRLVPIFRNGKTEDVYWTFSFNPAYDDTANIAGVFIVCNETTGKIAEESVINDNINQLQFAVEAAELGTWELNPITNKFTGNAILKSWFGLSEGDNIDLSAATNAISKKDIDKVNDAISRALSYESGGIYDIEYTIQNSLTGKDIVVKAKGKAYFNDKKEPYTFNGILIDVTEEANLRTQLAQKLDEQIIIRQKTEESEAHLELLRNTVPAMIFYLDAEQRYRSYNIVFMEWFGVNATEAIGKTVKEFIGAGYENLAPFLDKAYNGEQVTYEIFSPSKMSDAKWLSIVYTPHKNIDNKVIGVIVHATDITKSKQTELSLRSSEAKFRDLIEAAPAGIGLFVGRDLIIENPNQTFIDIVGKGPSIVGLPLREAMPELITEGQAFLKILDDVYTTGVPFISPASLVKIVQNGVLNDNYYNISYTPIRNAEGNIYAILDIAIDVTEQVKAQQKVEESEMRFRTMAEGTTMYIAVGDDSGNATYFNHAWSVLTGRPMQQLLKFGWADLVHPDDRKRYVDIYMEAFKIQAPFTDEVRVLSATGEYRWLLANGTARFTSDGSFAGYISSCVDITQQIEARQTVENKEKELRELITAAPIGICVLAAADARILEINDRFITMSGKSSSQFLEATYWEVFPEDAEKFAPVLNNVFQTGAKFKTEETEMWVLRNGIREKVFTTFEYVPVFDINNNVGKVIVIVIEVTHQVETRKKIEEAVVERTKELAEANLNLKRSNAELEQFAYIASHDLQEPVRKISTFTQMLERSVPDLSDKSKNYIGKIYSSTDRMTTLIRDVLAYSTVVHATENFEAIDLSQTLEIVKTEFELQIESKHAIIETSNLPVIMGSASQMVQLFANLLSNSLKFTKPGVQPIIKVTGSVATTEKVARHPMLNPDKKYHLVQFSDNGIGFEAEYAEKIFKIFQRLHGKSEFEGTGIGLSICKKIVQSHDGHIAAAEGENGGALFNILLPELG